MAFLVIIKSNAHDFEIQFACDLGVTLRALFQDAGYAAENIKINGNPIASEMVKLQQNDIITGDFTMGEFPEPEESEDFDATTAGPA